MVMDIVGWLIDIVGGAGNKWQRQPAGKITTGN